MIAQLHSCIVKSFVVVVTQCYTTQSSTKQAGMVKDQKENNGFRLTTTRNELVLYATNYICNLVKLLNMINTTGNSTPLSLPNGQVRFLEPERKRFSSKITNK